MVTGATAGIGLVTARELARAGATVIMVGRSRERGRDAVETIRRDTGNKLVSFIAVDLSSQASVRAFAQAFLGSHSRLHVLVTTQAVSLPYGRRASTASR